MSVSNPMIADLPWKQYGKVSQILRDIIHDYWGTANSLAN